MAPAVDYKVTVDHRVHAEDHRVPNPGVDPEGEGKMPPVVAHTVTSVQQGGNTGPVGEGMGHLELMD